MEKRIAAETAEKERRQKQRIEALKQKEQEKQQRDEHLAELSSAASRRVETWANGKSVVTMLTSMHRVVPGLVDKPFQLPAGATPAQVKSIYRRAVRLVHPDKLAQLAAGDASLEDQAAGAKIFSVLNDAWSAYRKRHDV
eukprot:g2195.t1